ncbi:hypothetical protein EE612_036648 [Oryza sativa]|nr:hypothetical protein EE612_036648 [Oryza sativa]
MAQQQGQGAGTTTVAMMSRNPSYYYSGEGELSLAVQRQDSLYRDASRAGQHEQAHGEGWARTLRLAFQCFGVLYGDIGTSPLYVYSTTFDGGIRHTDDLLGVLSLIIYSFLLFTIIKYVYIALRANDDGDGGTFALYSLISRHAKVSLVPNQQAEDELHLHISKSSSLRRPSVQRLASTAEERAQWVKDLLENSRPVRISLFLLTILATAMVISDACLTPAISVLSAVGGLKDKAPHLNTGGVGDGGHPGDAVRGAEVRDRQGGVPVRPRRFAVAPPHRRRRGVQPRRPRRRRPPRLQPKVHPRLLPPQRTPRLGLPRRRPPLLHRHRGTLRRPRLLQHPLHPAQLRLRPRPGRAAGLRRAGRLPARVPGPRRRRLLRVDAAGAVLANPGAGAGGVRGGQPGHDLLRLRHHLPLAGHGVLPAREGGAHVQAVPGAGVHPGDQPPAGRGRLCGDGGGAGHGGDRRGARHLRGAGDAHHHAAADGGDGAGVASEHRVGAGVRLRLRLHRVGVPDVGALQVRARRVHTGGHVGGADGGDGGVALRARQEVQVRDGEDGVDGEGEGACVSEGAAEGARCGALLHGPRAGDPPGVPSPHRQDPLHPHRPPLRLRQAPPRPARRPLGALPLPPGGAAGAQALPLRRALRLPRPPRGRPRLRRQPRGEAAVLRAGRQPVRRRRQ